MYVCLVSNNDSSLAYTADDLRGIRSITSVLDNSAYYLLHELKLIRQSREGVKVENVNRKKSLLLLPIRNLVKNIKCFSVLLE